jgi:DMSO/TMAO reductase YedYZ molybdopterin-dependent catalytic subunit
MILALEMNGARLPIEHGAPIRLRFQTQLGFKMVKWIKAIEFCRRPGRNRPGHGWPAREPAVLRNGAGI